MSLSFVHAGIDVSKTDLAVFIPDWGYREFENSGSGIRKLIRIALSIPNLILCCEASGGYEQELLEACLQQGLLVFFIFQVQANTAFVAINTSECCAIICAGAATCGCMGIIRWERR